MLKNERRTRFGLWVGSERDFFFDKDDFQKRKGRGGGLFHDFMVNNNISNSIKKLNFIFTLCTCNVPRQNFGIDNSRKNLTII